MRSSLTATMSKKERRGALTREITYQKVFMAVYMLSDDDGLACSATIARIGMECGHGFEGVRRSIRMMIDRGVVLAIGQWDGLNHRILVLADHPKARDYIADIKARIEAKFCEEMDQWMAKKQAGRKSRSQNIQ